MQGIRFYQDENNCGLAILYENKWIDYSEGTRAKVLVDAIGALYAEPRDGPYAGTSASLEYIRENCKRISEKTARARFPNLIKRLTD